MSGIDECLLAAMGLSGARGAAVVDWTSGLALGTIGSAVSGDHEVTAADTAELARTAAEQVTLAETARPGAPAATDAPGPPEPAVEDLIITTRDGYHLLRFVETAFDSSVFLHLWLDRRDGNLALARIRLAELARELVLS
ncbi:hypothetical protein GCM10023347_28530 [Streptomyces chumphonensis]|uniref:Uncharacterized protein n=1 Tax=Streptomyces chumphonensis TaxID=1214925 RepID=A0A927IBV9_9ACTN|nr:hypothetical protein [Streptomyces chumphonensis]MBD3931275.1 hypothetical protein [Streptomyces chumphonensis]